MVRQYMADEQYCQKPLLVWPGSRVADVEAFLNAQFDGQRPEPESDFLPLADVLSKYPNYGRAVGYLRRLAQQGSRISVSRAALICRRSVFVWHVYAQQ